MKWSKFLQIIIAGMLALFGVSMLGYGLEHEQAMFKLAGAMTTLFGVITIGMVLESDKDM